jgi:hypothetical protein
LPQQPSEPDSAGTNRLTADSGNVSRWTIPFALLILLVAIGLRWANFTSFPPGLWYDEAYHLNAAQEIALGSTSPQIYYPEKTGEPLIFWLTAVFLRLGAGHLAPRWVAAVGSMLSLFLFYFACRDIFRNRYQDADFLALGPTAVLATNYVYLFNSRLGWEPVLVTAAAIAVFWFYWRALVDNQWRWFLAAGFALGVSQYTGVIARSIPIVLLLFTFAWLWGARQPAEQGQPGFSLLRERLRSRFPGWVVLSTATLVCYLPLGRYFLRHPDVFSRRLATAAPSEQLLENLYRTVAGILWLEENALHGLDGRAILDWPVAILFVLGFLITLRTIRQPALAIWLAWLLGFLPGAVLSSPTPVFYRYLPIVPALAALSGVTLAESWSRWPRYRRGVLAVGAILLMLSGWMNGRDYFVRWAASPDMSRQMDTGKWAAAAAMLAADGESALFATMPYGVEPTVSYALQTVGGIRPFDGQNCLVIRDPAVQPLHFFSITGYERHSLDQLATLFPQGETEIDPIFAGQEPYFVHFQVPEAGEMHIPGVLATPVAFGSGEILLRGLDLPRIEALAPNSRMPITLTWQATAPIPDSLTAFVHLLSADMADPQPLKAQSDGIPCGSEFTNQWRSGELIIEQRQISVPADLPPGEYLVGVGLYRTDTLQRLPFNGADLRVAWGEPILRELTVVE